MQRVNYVQPGFNHKSLSTFFGRHTTLTNPAKSGTYARARIPSNTTKLRRHRTKAHFSQRDETTSYLMFLQGFVFDCHVFFLGGGKGRRGEEHKRPRSTYHTCACTKLRKKLSKERDFTKVITYRKAESKIATCLFAMNRKLSLAYCSCADSAEEIKRPSFLVASTNRAVLRAPNSRPRFKRRRHAITSFVPWEDAHAYIHRLYQSKKDKKHKILFKHTKHTYVHTYFVRSVGTYIKFRTCKRPR